MKKKQAKSVEPLEEVIDNLRTEIRNRHVKRLRKGKCTIEMGFVLTDLITNYERVADHCSNIAVCMIQIHDNSFDTHSYISDLKATNNEEYKQYSEVAKLIADLINIDTYTAKSMIVNYRDQLKKTLGL